MNVYVIEASNGHLKVGISRNPNHRLARLQTATPLKLSLVHIEPTDRAAEVEAAAHASLASKRLTGEWFAASLPEALDAIREAVLNPRPSRIDSGLRDFRVTPMMAATEVAAIDEWRRKQDDVPTRPEAIRRLVELALKVKPKG